MGNSNSPPTPAVGGTKRPPDGSPPPTTVSEFVLLVERSCGLGKCGFILGWLVRRVAAYAVEAWLVKSRRATFHGWELACCRCNKSSSRFTDSSPYDGKVEGVALSLAFCCFVSCPLAP